MTYENLQEKSRPVLLLGLLAAVCLMLMACQTRVQSQNPEPASEPVASEITQEPAAEENPIITPPVLVCPEPEPVPAPECPPVPEQKPCPVCPAQKIDGKMLIGEVEKVTINPPGITYTARIDSGASGTSIHATNIVRFERDGENWVRFELEDPNGGKIVMEREVVRRVRVKQVELDEFERRLKVMLTMKVGAHSELVEFSLNDRSEMEHPVLLGRNFLRNNAIVDVSQEFIAK